MSRRLSWMVGLALVVHAAGLAAERPAGVRLVEVTSASTAASQSVLITATEPASYTTRQPDPLTVLITLRDVTAGNVATRLRPAPDDPVTGVEVVDAVDADGNPVVQVRIRLREPTVYEVRSRRQTIQVRFARPVASMPAPAPEDEAAPPLVGRGRPATAILSVETAVELHAISVTLHGNGALTPGRIHESEHLPPRLVIEFPHLATEASAVTSVEIDPVKQVRVASEGPELTRVVLDLARPAVYHIERPGSDDRMLRVVFPRDRAIDPVARIGPDPASETAAAWTAEAAIPELASGGPPRTGAGSNAPDVLGAAPSAPTTVVAPFDVTALAPLAHLTGPVGVRGDGSPLLHPDLADVPARVWPRIRQLTGAVVALAPDAALLLSPEPGDLPSPLDDADTDTALRVTPPAVVAEVSTSQTAPRTTAAAAVVEPPAVETVAAVVEPAVVVTPVATTTAPETLAVPVAASSATERFLPLRGSAQAAGAPAPRTAMRLSGQPLTGQEYTGDPISMDFQNTDLRAVLRVFAEISGLNLVIDPSVQGEVNVALTQVPWDQAFAIILRANQLFFEVDGTVVRIASVQRLQEEAADRALLAQREAEAGELILDTFPLSYARAEDLVTLLTNTVLSPRGELFTDARTNTLIIKDLEAQVTAARDLVGRLDRAEPQVEIEARIVQASHDTARALGVQWGITGRVAQEIGNTLPFSFPNRGGISGRAGNADGPDQGPSGIDSRALEDENALTVVNLPVGGASSAIGLTMGAVNGALNLDVILSALESEGELSIISSPRVMTQNNVEAEILQGDQIPYQTVANNTVTVQFKEAALQLRVTPQITMANTVIMQIALENSFPDFARALGNPPIPPIVTQRATTTVQVRDGETTVIGGIYENTQTRRDNRTPFLHRIPLLGWLFKSSNQQETTDELMIFITPRIVR